MKKFIALILSILLLISSLCACKSGGGDQSGDVPEEGGEQEPLRVFIDVDFGSYSFDTAKELMKNFEEIPSKSSNKRYKKFQDVIADLGGPEDIELEFAPKCGDERDAYLTSLRTEMMAGKGPDVFVTLSGYGNHWDDASLSKLCREDALFKFPQQAMERNMFLPLDGYIGKAQFMKWDKLTPVIMDAGRNEHGQLLLPMTYTVPVAIFKKDEVGFRLEGSEGLTWRDMVEGPPELLGAAGQSHMSRQSTALAPIADYENDKLAMTEEELLYYVTARLDAGERLKKMDLPEGSVNALMPLNWFDEEYGSENELTMVPVFSRSGGYTAIVTSFLGVNVNTKRPEDAFFIADYLMSKEGQQSRFYSLMTWGNAVPTMEGLLSGRGYGVSDGTEGYIYMSKNLYPEFEKLRGGISGADFYTPLDGELFDLMSELLDAPSKPVEGLVHDAYMRMSMELAES